MSRIQDLLKNEHDRKLDYDDLLKRFPWINEKARYCVLSPDSDGFLCGLFMAKYRNWKVVGFYDDKLAVVNPQYLDRDPVFLDGEIFRKEIKSMGHHMLRLNKNKDVDFSGFSNCIQPNLLRNYDGKHDFRLKYPLATIHMLVSILAYADYKDGVCEIKFTDSAIPPLFFTDGVFNVLFSYPENVLNWLSYLRVHEDWNPLKPIFENESDSVFSTMKRMDDFFRKRDEISAGKERGDRLKISSKNGEPYNLEQVGDLVSIHSGAASRARRFLEMIGERISCLYDDSDWICWENLKYFKFTKDDFRKRNWTLTNENFDKLMALNPLSWAMTSLDKIEFTLEQPSELRN